MIVVLDSSVWISALHFRGTPLRVLALCTARFRIAVCDAILDEIQTALKRKFDWRAAEIDKALAIYAREMSIIRTRGTLRGVCRDANDDVIIECAMLAGAEIIVTGDKDLLVVRNYRDIRIVAPREFLDEFDTRPEI